MDHKIRPNKSFSKYTKSCSLTVLIRSNCRDQYRTCSTNTDTKNNWNALAKVRIPVTERACSTPTVADAL